MNMCEYSYGVKNAVALWRGIKQKTNTTINPIFLFNTPNYYNLGDHAIYIAERLLLENLFGERIIAISDEVFDLYKNNISEIVPKEALIFFTGGGNIGTLWPFVEDRLRWLVGNFKNNKIVCFPNTAFYERTPQGIFEQNKSYYLFLQHRQLLFCWREEDSALFFKDNFPNIPYIIAPDMAFLLSFYFDAYLENLCQKQQKQIDILVMLRKDRESVCSNYIYDIISKLSLPKFYTDMADDNKKIYTYKQSVSEVKRKLKEISCSRAVITDRLHGIIFSLLVGTPCLVINNVSHKIKGTISLIKQSIPNANVEFFDETKSIDEQLENVNINNPHRLNFNEISKLYSELFGAIRNI